MSPPTSNSANRPPARYGQRLLPVVLDELAQSDPNRIYASIPGAGDLSHGFREITVLEVSRCVNYMCQWLRERFGRSLQFETISYIGIPDLRGAITFLAAVKCGYKLLLPSPRNPPSTNVALMEQTGSTKLLHTSEVAPVVAQIISQHKEATTHIEAVPVPSLSEMLASTPPAYPFTKSFADARDDPIVVLHSSGSTGLPKPITMTHGSFAVLDNERNLSAPDGRVKQDWSIWDIDGGGKFFTVFPFFHLAGFVGLVINPIFMCAFPVLGPPNMLPDGQLLKQVMQQQTLATLYLPPAIVEQLFYEPDGIEYFRKLQFLVYTGAPFSPDVGDQLSRVTRLVSPFGSTEVFPLPGLATSREDWAWFEFNPHLKFEMQPHDVEPGTFEMVLFADETTLDTQAMNHNLPGVTEWRTKDLFKQHPQKPNLWKYFGRKDDIIVLHNGEKFNPVPLEVTVQNHPLLAGALVVGQGRFNAALLVEPKATISDDERQNLLESIWPLVEQSNSLVAGQGRILRDKILVVTKPTVRTGKGTIVRTHTERAFASEISHLYANSESSNSTSHAMLKPTSQSVYEINDVTNFVRDCMARCFPQASSIDENSDLYSFGLDSLQTLEIVSGIKRGLAAAVAQDMSWISATLIFRYPTIAELSQILQRFLNDGAIPDEESDRTLAREFEDCVAKYTRSLPSRDSGASSSPATPATVALLGSTGFLGTYLLARLMVDPDVTCIICLNRGGDSQQRQYDSLRRYGFHLDDYMDKVRFFRIDLSQQNLGLAPPEYQVLQNSVDRIIFNAWRLDFSVRLRSFEPFLAAVRATIDLSLASPRNPRVCFISSLASVLNWPRLHPESKIPEFPSDELRAALPTGYGQSKLAAEHLLGVATERSKVPVDIMRVGQIGGPSTRGLWPEQPWLAALIKTSRTMGCFPENVALVDWMPVDMVADVVRTILWNAPATGPQVYNISHPRPPPWSTLIEVVKTRYNVTEVVSLPQWVEKLRDSINPDPETARSLPALLMLDHYRSLGDSIAFPVANDRALGNHKGVIPDLKPELLAQWLENWQF